MKRIVYPILLAVLCLWAGGCVPAGRDLSGPVPVEVSVVDGVSVKSSHAKGEAEVRNLSLALYEDGVLRGSWYFTSTENLSVPGVTLSRCYDVYALANVGQVTFPAQESGIPSMSLAWSGVSDGPAWPMAFAGNVLAVTGAVIRVPLVRLVARVDLTVDTDNLSLYSFQANAVRLMSGAGDCRPFVAESVPLTGAVRTDESSATDVQAVNAGGVTSYYLFESCFGDLLPDNHDAWEKVPDNLSGGVTPPYVEIGGTLTVNDNSGSSRSVTYRFYLGQNATRNFDVVRNTVNTVTLQLSDDNVDRGSWKVEAGTFDEKAQLYFDSSTLTIPWLSTGSVIVCTVPSNLKFRVYEKDDSMSSAGLAYYVNGKFVVITSTRAEATTGVLYASTIDGRLECSCRISTTVPPVTLKKIDLKCTDQYVDYLDAYIQDLGWWFTCKADLTYSDGTVVTDVTDFSDFEWFFGDDALLGPALADPNLLWTLEPGETTGYLKYKDGNVYSNSLLFIIYSPDLYVRAAPDYIDCGASSVLMASYGGRDVSRTATWRIVEGSEYGAIEDDLYSRFVSNGTNASAVSVVIEGEYDGHTATCDITVAAPDGGSPGLVSRELVVTPSSASIDYDGTQSFTAVCYTLNDGVRTGESRDVTSMAAWSVSDTDYAKISGMGVARGCNTDQASHTVQVSALYAGCSASAQLTVGPAPDGPGPGPGPGPDPDPDEPVLTGISLSLDKDRIWYGESVRATVTAWYDDGSSRDVTSSVTSWPSLEGCTRSGNAYTHAVQGLHTEAYRSVSVSWGGFGAMREFSLGRQYAARVEAVFPSSLSWSSERQEKPSYRLVYNDSAVLEGRPGDLDYFTVDGGAPQQGGMEIGARDYALGTHVLTVYRYATTRTGLTELLSGSMTFTVVN